MKQSRTKIAIYALWSTIIAIFGWRKLTGGTAMEGLIAGTTYRNPQTGARCRLLRSYTDSTWMLWEYEMRGLKRIGRHSGYMEAAEMVEYLKDYEEGVEAQ